MSKTILISYNGTEIEEQWISYLQQSLEYRIVPMNVAKADANEQAFTQYVAAQLLKKYDAWLCMSGFQPDQPFEELTVEQWSKALFFQHDVPFLLLQYLLHHQKLKPYAVVLMLHSVAGVTGNGSLINSTCSSMLQSFVKGIGKELSIRSYSIMLPEYFWLQNPKEGYIFSDVVTTCQYLLQLQTDVLSGQFIILDGGKHIG